LNDEQQGEKSVSNIRNSQLLQQVGRHPLKAALARCFDVAETFQGDVEFLQLNDGLSPKGRQDALQAKLRAAIRDLRDARAPINEMQKKLEAQRAAVSMPKFDPADIVGFLRRQELRAAMRTMDRGERAVLIANDAAFADALLEQPPSLSGLVAGEKFIVDNAREQRLGALFGPQQAEIEALEETIKQANMIADLAHNDLKLHSEMDDRAFTEFVRPIENRQGAPWLVKHGDTVTRVRPELRGTPGLHQPATPEEIANGVFFKDEAEFRASRAA
jgi:hypothetical protein